MLIKHDIFKSVIPLWIVIPGKFITLNMQNIGKFFISEVKRKYQINPLKRQQEGQNEDQNKLIEIKKKSVYRE